MFDEYTEPVREDSDDYKPRDHIGNACIVKVTEHKNAVDTVNGPAPAVYADIYDLVLGQVFRGVMLMGGAFVDGLKSHVGKLPVVITWEARTSKAGRTYAFPVAATPGERAKAADVYKNGDPFLVLGSIDDAEAPF